ncbi:hypothetical protein [Vibrio phage PJN101]|nr:hypothetical protein [Vibrio phage PJN101]
MSKKPSVMIETLIKLMELDNNEDLICSDTICNRCKQQHMCHRCPFEGRDADEESLRALLPLIKTWELIDE